MSCALTGSGWHSEPAEVFRQALEEAWRTRPQAPKLVSVPGLDPDEIARGTPDGEAEHPQKGLERNPGGGVGSGLRCS